MQGSRKRVSIVMWDIARSISISALCIHSDPGKWYGNPDCNSQSSFIVLSLCLIVTSYNVCFPLWLVLKVSKSLTVKTVQTKDVSGSQYRQAGMSNILS